MKILISSAAAKVPLVRAMQLASSRISDTIKVVAGDLSSSALTFYVADESWVMPPTTEAFLGEIIGGCKKRQIKLILPTRDSELLFWAKHRDKFLENGIKIVVSPFNSLLICIDKFNFSKFCSDKALSVIPSYININDCYFDNFVVKERFGAGSRSIGINLNVEQATGHAKFLKEPIFQPFIEGKEFSADLWVDRDHKVKGVILRTRDLVINGESQVTTTFFNSEIEEKVVALIESIGLYGPVVVQGIIDSCQNIHIIECNPRFGGASTLGIVAGVDSFFWSILDALDFNLNSYSFSPVSQQLRQIRLPADIYRDVDKI